MSRPVEARLTLHFPDATDPDVALIVMGDAAELIENHWDVVVSVGLRDSLDYELVRVQREMVERLLAQEPQPVVLAGLERHRDGTVDLTFRTPELPTKAQRAHEEDTNARSTEVPRTAS